MPIRSHGLASFSSIIMLDLAQPDRLWTDLEAVLNGLKQATSKHSSLGQTDEMKELTMQRIDSWERIGVTPTNSERIGHSFVTQIPQVPISQNVVPDDPGKDPGFKESTIDELRSHKDEELLYVLKDTEIRMKFEVVQ
ncbi:hypothetical protein AND_007913 [Anopheles darlingi]|uniref:Uncharacterized protein n=1 Tax=Anopheles darlingi TaxID=43151 RepID=W5J917_ANODA|nr:hypothetical protein AND_007913 [Anopheles darlingi]